MLIQIHFLAFLIDCEALSPWKCAFIVFLESQDS